MYHLLPLSYDEFITWYRLGTKRISRNRLHKIKVNKQGELKSDEKVVRQIMADLPDHEDDWQVLLVQLDLPARRNGKGPHEHIELELSKVSSLVPLSERGRRILSTKLDADVRLEQPFFEAAFAKEDERRHKMLAIRGGRALLECFGLGHYECEFESRQDDVWRAMMLRHEEAPFPAKDAPFIANLFCYDRRESRYPRTSMGFAHDLGKVVLEHTGSASKTLDVLTKFKIEALSGRNEKDWVTELPVLQPHFRKIEEFTEGYSGVTCVAFLEMQNRLRAEPSVRNLEALNKHLRKDNERDLALAIWLTGVFFDFAPFASEYYQRVSAPFVGSPPPPAPERSDAQWNTSGGTHRVVTQGRAGKTSKEVSQQPREQLPLVK